MTPPSLHFHAPTLPPHDAAHLSTMLHFSIRFAAAPCFGLQHAAMIRERDNAAGQYLNAGGGRGVRAQGHCNWLRYSLLQTVLICSIFVAGWSAIPVIMLRLVMMKWMATVRKCTVR